VSPPVIEIRPYVFGSRLIAARSFHAHMRPNIAAVYEPPGRFCRVRNRSLVIRTNGSLNNVPEQKNTIRLDITGSVANINIVFDRFRRRILAQFRELWFIGRARARINLLTVYCKRFCLYQTVDYSKRILRRLCTYLLEVNAALSGKARRNVYSLRKCKRRIIVPETDNGVTAERLRSISLLP